MFFLRLTKKIQSVNFIVSIYSVLLYNIIGVLYEETY